MAVAEGNTQFSITLPNQALAMIKDLEETGMFGSNRAEISRTLVLQRLIELAEQDIVALRRWPTEPTEAS